MSAAFTPGPWEPRAKANRVHVPGLGQVARIENPWNNAAERDANTRLIAAAPDLYEALVNLMENPLFQTAVGGNPNAVDRMLDHARAALAKARGGA